MTERLEKQQKIEIEKKKKLKHLEFINAVLVHGTKFREYHKGITGKVQKVSEKIKGCQTVKLYSNQYILVGLG